MGHTKTTRYALFLTLTILVPIFGSSIPQVHGATTYFLTPVPVFTQEGYSITLVLTVVGALSSTPYQFAFFVRDPSGKVWNSTLQSHNTTATETQFSILIVYPSTSFGGVGRSSLVGQYNAQVNQIRPIPLSNVASTPFFILLTDLTEYQRTQTVSIRASGYNATESASVTIRTQTTSTLVFSRTIFASFTGIVQTSWKIPRNATIDNYVVTVTGTKTVKSPPDVQGLTVKAASISIASLSSSKSSYERTETMLFSFAPLYPDGTTATTGVALLTLRSPSNVNVTLTASYNSTANQFEAKYQTFRDNATGTWTAQLPANAYGDGFGNTGPAGSLSSAPQLVPASLRVNIFVNSYFTIGQQIRFNATITYPDGTAYQSGTTGAFLLYSGSSVLNYTIPVIFDNTLNMWVGSYNPQATDPGGLWSLTVRGTDSASPPNTGAATRAITLQDRPPIASFSSSTSSTITGQAVNFDGSGSYDPDGTVLTYTWNFGDGTTGNGVQITHIYNTAQGAQQVYTVTLIVADNSGSTGSAFSQITVADRPPVLSFTKSTNSTTVGQTVTISFTTSDPDGTLSSIKVDWGDGAVDTLAGTATSDLHSYSSAGSTGTTGYSIVVTVIDNSGLQAVKSSTITIQSSSTSGSGSSSGSLSIPLFYFGILAAIVAALLVGAFLAFRRHKVTHTKLKIDLEAVKSEAGRIENQEFFQSVKDQLKKDKEQ